MKQGTPQPPTCSHTLKPVRRPAVDPARIDRAARLLRAMGDGPRLTILQYLAGGECCVTEIVAATGEKFPTVSQRLRVLRTEGLVKRRRVGLHVYYSLADGHVAGLLANALDHAGELSGTGSSLPTEEDE
jgi:ArsR family transcriptional regulator, lead/cadmium/zinc/bismuth-responsive transcriptional repressor